MPRAMRGALVFLLGMAGLAMASGLAAAAVPPDSASAVLHIETKPESLAILVDGLQVGSSPLTVAVSPGMLRVRAVPRDPRRSELPADVMEVKVRAGETTLVVLDLRPSVVIRSDPEPAQVILKGRATGPDSLLGETPLRLAPAIFETASLELMRPGYADTTLLGSAILLANGPYGVALRATVGLSRFPAPRPSTPTIRKRWFAWTLIGVGAALSGAAVVFHHQGDRWYDQYLASSDVNEIPVLYDRAVRYDHMAAVSLGIGQGSLIAGVFLLMTGQSR
jgi:hypothetical protein